MKMRIFKQNKIWRYKLIDQLEKSGSRISWRLLNDSEYDQQLRIKLIEEANEVQTSTSKNMLIEELADVLEIINTLCALHHISFEEIKVTQNKKFNERGGFLSRKFIETAAHPENSFGERYCLADPQKYPEITKNNTD